MFERSRDVSLARIAGSQKRNSDVGPRIFLEQRLDRRNRSGRVAPDKVDLRLSLQGHFEPWRKLQRPIKVRERLLQPRQIEIEPSALHQNLRRIRLDREPCRDRRGRLFVVPELDAYHALARDRFRVARLKSEGAIETPLGALELTFDQLRHAPIAKCIGIVRLQPDSAFVQLDSLLGEAHVQQRIAEIGQGDRRIRLQRNRLLLACASVLKLLEGEIHCSEITMGIGRTRIERRRALEQLLRLVQPPAIIRAQAEQVSGVEMIRNLRQNPAAECLDFRVSALPECLNRGGHERVRLLLQFLLQPRVQECARAGAALQSLSPEDGPKRGWPIRMVPSWRIGWTRDANGLQTLSAGSGSETVSCGRAAGPRRTLWACWLR